MAKKKKTPPIGLTEEAKREWERYLAAYNAFLEQVRQVSLTILVWGPNPESKSEVARKRHEIRDELRRLGHNALFSEELPQPVEDISEKSKEFAQALAAHLIIILVEDAPGALAEACDFCNHPKIAPKVYVLIPLKYREGYGAQGAIRDLADGHGGVYWYNDTEMSACSVRDRAIKRAEAIRHILYRAGV